MANTCIDCGANISTRATRCKSCASKVRWQNHEVRQKMLEGLKKAHSSSEFREKMSKAAKSSWKRGVYDSIYTEEVRQKMSRGIRKALANPEVRHRKSEAAKASWARGAYNAVHDNIFTEEVRHKISSGIKAAWERGAFNNRRPVGNPSKLELSFLEALRSRNIECISQFSPENYSKVYDIFLINYSVLLEVDGTYWHSFPEAKKNDAEKGRWAIENGYSLIRIPEERIRRLGMENVADKVYMALSVDV